MVLSPHRYRAAAPQTVSSHTIDRVLALEASQAALGVQPIYSLGHLSYLTAVPYGYLRSVVRRDTDGYAIYSVKKRDGLSDRSIAAPNNRLKATQKWLLKNVFGRLPAHGASFAYQQNRSAPMCARRHLGARWLMRIDLRDFFHQTDEIAVYQLARSLRYSELVSFELARIVTRMPHLPQSWLPEKYAQAIRRTTSPDFPYPEDTRLGYLPQGAPTSGAISNLLARSLDLALDEMATASEMVYTRYADDLILSSASPFRRSDAQAILHRALATVSTNGYAINERKTRLVSGGRRLEVLGIRVDGDQLRLPIRMTKQIEYHLRGVEKFGAASHQLHAGFKDAIGMFAFIRGLIDYANDVDPITATVYYQRLSQQIPQVGRSSESS